VVGGASGAGGTEGSRPYHERVVDYPGGYRVRYRWTGSGARGGHLPPAEGGWLDLGHLVDPEADRLCRAEVAVRGPAGEWVVRLASRISGEPQGLYWDEPGLLVVGYGFAAYGFRARTGELRWQVRTGTPLIAVLASPRLGHVLLQSELETVAVDGAGDVLWRALHSDVVTEVTLTGGRLVLTSYGGQRAVLDPVSGERR